MIPNGRARHAQALVMMKKACQRLIACLIASSMNVPSVYPWRIAPLKLVIHPAGTSAQSGFMMKMVKLPVSHATIVTLMICVKPLRPCRLSPLRVKSLIFSLRLKRFYQYHSPLFRIPQSTMMKTMYLTY